ncbi:hypothetical protein [Citreimonas sp.]|uniref:hypothetical protein n=1 Tax=Citreimonas sp. TaxID=3036715 RepID=UPI0035C7F645
MCGEIDEQVLVGQDLMEHLRVIARRLDLPDDAPRGGAPRDLAEADGRAAYMEATFRAGLAHALADIARADEAERVDALASQAIALARLAGFLAGQLPPEADLFRATIEALTAGHSEPRDMADDILRHRHDHHHHDHHHHHEH